MCVLYYAEYPYHSLLVRFWKQKRGSLRDPLCVYRGLLAARAVGATAARRVARRAGIATAVTVVIRHVGMFC